MRTHKGILITFEKTAKELDSSTQAKRLHDALASLGVSTILTKECGGTPTGEKLEAILKDSTVELSKATELFLIMADRSQHYKEVLKPSLRSGKVVISDSYFDSTLVYQGSAGGWKTAFLLRLHQATTGMLFPSLTFILDSPPCLGSEYQHKIREGMLYFASKADRYIMIDASQPEDAIAEQILTTTLQRLPSLTL